MKLRLALLALAALSQPACAGLAAAQDKQPLPKGYQALVDNMGDRPVATGSTKAVLQGLNKVTAQISRMEARVGETIRFGGLSITPRDCWRSPPGETPESLAYLQIEETGSDDPQPHPVFSGWMFASSPALSAMDNALYDVWLLQCDDGTGAAAVPKAVDAHIKLDDTVPDSGEPEPGASPGAAAPADTPD